MRNLIDRTFTRRRALALIASAAGISLLNACFDDDRSVPAASGESTPRPTWDFLPTPSPTAMPEIGPDGHFREIQIFGDGTKHLIPITEIVDGGPDKDDIPSIEEPQFVGPEQWEAMNYRDDGFVIGVEVDGDRRAYPFQVLIWHEIVNDTFNGVPLLVTYCPLCGSAIAFRREINDGEVVEFGVSGRLYNSDLLMYDRVTDTLWSQLTGTAVVGELTGQRLEFYPSELLTWAEWKRAYPESQVLSRETGHPRNYDSSPYGDYAQTPSIGFPVAGRDDRLHPKTRITGVELDATTFAAYPDETVREHGPVNDLLGDTPLLIVSDPRAGGNILIFERVVDGDVLTFASDGEHLSDDETGSRWTYDGLAVEGELEGSRLHEIETVKSFWFAWYAFHQTTALWQPEAEE